MSTKLDIIFLGASSLNSLVQNPEVLFSSLLLHAYNDLVVGEKRLCRRFILISISGGFIKKQIIFVQLQSLLCSVPDSSWESVRCACNFQGLLSIMHLMHSLQQLTKEVSYKEKEILWSSQEESGEGTKTYHHCVMSNLCQEVVHFSESF